MFIPEDRSVAWIPYLPGTPDEEVNRLAFMLAKMRQDFAAYEKRLWYEMDVKIRANWTTKEIEDAKARLTLTQITGQR